MNIIKKIHKDLVSIIIPFYNEKYYFDKCVSSVLKQTYSNIEIIIVNDGSDQIYLNKLKNLQSNHPEIKILHKKNEGAGLARNLGIKIAKGKYIAFLDADDEWRPFKLDYQLSLINKYDLDFIHSSYLVKDENEKYIGKFIAKKISYIQLLDSCDIGLSTVLVKSSLMKKYLFPKIISKEDFVCWLRIAKNTSYLYGDKRVVSTYRKKKLSLSGGLIRKFKNAFIVYYKYEKMSFCFSILKTIILSINHTIKQKRIMSNKD